MVKVKITERIPFIFVVGAWFSELSLSSHTPPFQLYGVYPGPGEERDINFKTPSTGIQTHNLFLVTSVS